MPQALDLIGLGMAPPWANELGNSATTLTTTGTTQADAATVLSTNVTLTTAASQTGAKLPSTTLIGTPFYISNPTATTAVIYPPGTDTINGASSISVSQNTTAIVWRATRTTWAAVLTESGSGSVTSVALSLPNVFTVSGSPVTTSGTLTGSLATQVGNLVFSSPSDGSTAVPAFRALVNADLPAAISSTGLHTTFNATAPAAGGGATPTGYLTSSTAKLGVIVGSGTPTLQAAQGCLYLNTTGSGVNSRLYINSNGTVAWVAVVTAS
jgi:hypothetical protein